MVSDARSYQTRGYEAGNYRQRWYQTHGRYWTRCRYQTRGGIPRGRYQTRGGIRRAEKRIGCRAVRGRGGRGRRIDR